jgi:hypothetical protein
MELANFQAEKHANISRENRVPEWFNFQNFTKFKKHAPELTRSFS